MAAFRLKSSLNGSSLPTVLFSSQTYRQNYVKYLGVILDKRITWRLHIEMIEATAFRTFISIYSLFKSERLSANIKLTLHKAMIGSVVTYDCPPPQELVANTSLLKMQCMHNKVLHDTGNFPKCTLVYDLHTAFNLPYV
jgi:hypothetical protein